jgi:general secretion pathway protein I
MRLLVMQTDTLLPGPYLKQRRQAGLTLIEVLVALAIIAIALTAIIKSVAENIRGISYLEDKTIAMYVAEQVINEVRVGLLPLPQTLSEKTEMLGKEWYWQAQETTSSNPRIKKINVKVYRQSPEDDDAATVIDMDGFMYVGNPHE